MISIKFVLFLMVVSTLASDQDECNLCKNPKEHIFCIFPSPSPMNKPECASADTSVTDDKFRKMILDWHNDYRDKFAAGKWKDQQGRYPQAADMRALKYDMELEKLAMRNAQNCYFNHERCRKTKRFDYGQNLGYRSSSDKNTLLSQKGNWYGWVEEMKNYQPTPSNIEKFATTGSKDQVLHFTQATWASLQYIGCAQVLSKSGSMWRFDVACNYGPGGNMMGDKFYSIGKPCSKCPSGTKCGSKYTNLCFGDGQAEEGSPSPVEDSPAKKTKKPLIMSKGKKIIISKKT